MAGTLSNPFPQQEAEAIGSLRGTIIRVTWATNGYATGGQSLAASAPSGTVIGAVVLSSTGTGAVTQIPSFDVANNKLQLIAGAAGANAEVANGTSDAQVVTVLLLTA